jgi:hypothetical protein
MKRIAAFVLGACLLLALGNLWFSQPAQSEVVRAPVAQSGCTTYTHAGGTIPSGGDGLNSTMIIPPGPKFTYFTTSLTINHDHPSDLVARIIPPFQCNADLFVWQLSETSFNGTLTFANYGLWPISDADYPYSSVYEPNTLFGSGLRGGRWTMSVYSAGDSGTLDSWSVDICTGSTPDPMQPATATPEPTWTPAPPMNCGGYWYATANWTTCLTPEANRISSAVCTGTSCSVSASGGTGVFGGSRIMCPYESIYQDYSHGFSWNTDYTVSGSASSGSGGLFWYPDADFFTPGGRGLSITDEICPPNQTIAWYTYSLDTSLNMPDDTAPGIAVRYEGNTWPCGSPSGSISGSVSINSCAATPFVQPTATEQATPEPRIPVCTPYSSSGGWSWW